MATLQALLGVELPIIQAPMAGVQGSKLAVAVSNAGGLGSLPCAMLSLEALREELRVIKAQTDKPVNVNFFCHAPPAPSPEREARWREALSTRTPSLPRRCGRRSAPRWSRCSPSCRLPW